MAGTIRFVYNPLIENELRVSPAVMAILERKAQQAAAAAKGFAPVLEESDSRYTPGEARESIHVILGIAHSYIVMDPLRPDGESYGAYIEFGTELTPSFHPLRKGLETLGART